MKKIENSNLSDSYELNNSVINKRNKKAVLKVKKKNKKMKYFLFDNFKGILIFMVVFGHFLWN